MKACFHWGDVKNAAKQRRK